MNSPSFGADLPRAMQGATRALTSVPWSAERPDVPAAAGVSSQVVPLFTPSQRPRLRRYLLLCEHAPLPERLLIEGIPATPDPQEHFSSVYIQTIAENLDKKPDQYNYCEGEARIHLGEREIGLRLALLPSNCARAQGLPDLSSWQWCQAERLWSGTLAEAWRIGGFLIPYPVRKQGSWVVDGFVDMGNQICEKAGDVLHGDIYLIIWRSGCLQLTCHFKAGYFHTWPKPIPAFPLVVLTDLNGRFTDGAVDSQHLLHDGGNGDVIDFGPTSLSFAGEYAGAIGRIDNAVLIQPWRDLRALACKTKENELHYLEPPDPAIKPAGVSRSFWFNIGLNGSGSTVARYLIPPSAYCAAGQLETDRPGPAAQMAGRTVKLMKQYTHCGGFDTGRMWRYLRRDQRSGKPEQDTADWDGNLAQGMFTFAYQCGESPSESWQLYLHQAYHCADVAVYHGAWLPRLEGSVALTAPLPKFRFGGMLLAYLETGDPYLLEISRSLAGVYMAMEWANQPRWPMGRDAYPLTSILALWDYSAEPLYLDFARQTATRLLRTQEEDAGFSRQAGAGFTGRAAVPNPRDISFGSGLLAPLSLLEWAVRDSRWPEDLRARLHRWADLMLKLQPPEGVWKQNMPGSQPYPLIGTGAMFSLIKVGELLGRPECTQALRRFLTTMNSKEECVAGTHAFLSPLYAHVADAALCPE